MKLLDLFAHKQKLLLQMLIEQVFPNVTENTATPPLRPHPEIWPLIQGCPFRYKPLAFQISLGGSWVDVVDRDSISTPPLCFPVLGRLWIKNSLLKYPSTWDSEWNTVLPIRQTYCVSEGGPVRKLSFCPICLSVWSLNLWWEAGCRAPSLLERITAGAVAFWLGLCNGATSW